MGSGRRLGIGAVVLGVVLGTFLPAAADRPAAASQAAGEHTLTLVTGDRVTVVDGAVRSVAPAAGREDMVFSGYSALGHHYLVPADAQRLVDTGRVDRRLFDITTLLEFGYTDGIPLIVTGDALPAVRSARTLPAVNGMAVEADASGALWNQLTSARSAGESKIWLDGKRKSTLDRSTAQIGAPAAWEAGYTGDGVTVAVLDTGVDQTHPDLDDREIAERNFTESPDNVDRYGHGTHVASIVAGSGAKYRGVASGASILDGKILDDFGWGQDSWIIAGMQWAIEQGADVVNMSLGSTDLPGIDPLEEAMNTLSAEHDTLFVVSSGNDGATGTVSSPGSAASALTVGAVDRDDTLAGFSSQGPTPGDGLLKPDITAPGVGIVAALHADGVIGPPVEPGYTAISGTSMAAPHVAGSAALLAQQHPDWTGAQLKAALTGSAVPNADLGAYAQGAGRVDVARAITQNVVSEPASLDFGSQDWPHDEEPVTSPLAYRNLSATDVTLSLTLDTTAPDGMFSLSADEVTVPAGGTAQVSVTADSSVGTVDGPFSGAVVATGDETSVRTAVGLVREIETYTLTIEYLDQNGERTPSNTSRVFGLDTEYLVELFEEDGVAELELPRGRYLVDGIVTTWEGDTARYNVLVQPNIDLSADTTVRLDSRLAKPVSVTPPVEATMLLGDIGFSLRGEPNSYGNNFLADDLSTVYTAHLGSTEAPAGFEFTSRVNTQWSGPNEELYGLAWFDDTMPTGFTRVVEQDDLATVHADIGAVGTERTAAREVTPDPVVGGTVALAADLRFPLPAKRTEYVNTDGVEWSSHTTQLGETDADVVLSSPLRRYQSGRTYEERFNYPNFGPSLPDTGATGGWTHRGGDTLIVDVPLFGDASGNAGTTPNVTGSTTLYAGDEVIGESEYPSGVFTVPAERQDYRAVVVARRGAPFELATEVSAEWTFSSAHVPTGNEPIGVSALRFHPKVDDTGAAPAGGAFAVPVLLQRNGGATERARGLTVEASYDEGKTWKRVPVLLDTVAVLHHPADADTVSLRASARDKAGNTVKQTIIRAYHLK